MHQEPTDRPWDRQQPSAQGPDDGLPHVRYEKEVEHGQEITLPLECFARYACRTQLLRESVKPYFNGGYETAGPPRKYQAPSFVLARAVPRKSAGPFHTTRCTGDNDFIQ
jgi:hypothetical protein